MKITKDELKELNEKGVIEVRKKMGVYEYYEKIELL